MMLKAVLIDSSAVARGLLNTVLTDGGYDVCGQTHTSALGLALLVKHRPHFVCIAREQVEDGTNVVQTIREQYPKTLIFMISGGIAGEHEQITTPQLTRDEMAAAISTAHAWGRKVTAHAGPAAIIAEAIEMGLDCVEHGYELTPEVAARIAPVSVRLVDERLTTVDAHRALRGSGVEGRRHRAVVDQAAAVLILQAALDTERSTGRPPGEPATAGRRKPRTKGTTA